MSGGSLKIRSAKPLETTSDTDNGAPKTEDPPQNHVTSTSILLSPSATKSVEFDSGCESSPQGRQHVSFHVKKTRTPSFSEVEHKQSIIESIKSTPGGTEYIERDTVNTRKRMTPRGSLYFEQESLLTRRVALKSGSAYEETDIIVEKDSESVSAGRITSYISEAKVRVEKPSPSLKDVDSEKKFLLDGKNKGTEGSSLCVAGDGAVNLSKASSGYNSCSGSEEEERQEADNISRQQDGGVLFRKWQVYL